MGDMADGPDADRDRIAYFWSKLVNQPAHEKETAGISRLKRGDNVAIVIFVPAQFLAQIRREQAEHGPINIVDGGSYEQQRDNRPAIAACFGDGACRFTRCHFRPPRSARPFRPSHILSCILSGQNCQSALQNAGHR